MNFRMGWPPWKRSSTAAGAAVSKEQVGSINNKGAMKQTSQSNSWIPTATSFSKLSLGRSGRASDRVGAEPPPPPPSWHAMTVAEVLVELNLLKSDSSAGNISAEDAARAYLQSGLDSEQASARLEEYGPNQLTEGKKRTLIQRIWAQVANVLVGILVVVAVVSAIRAITSKTVDNIVNNWIQVAIIVGVITLNTWIGVMQEGSAEKAAEALKAMLSSNAKVIRDGAEVEIPAGSVVPGDLIVLALGDRIPADLRMVKTSNLACQEAALTGESLAVDKTTEPIVLEGDGVGDDDPSMVPLGDRKNMSFSATLVAQGGGVGLVVATGDHTQIGTINALVSKVERKKTNVLKQIDQVAKLLAGFILLTCLVTFLVAYLKTGLEPLESISIALVCAVAMIPEGLEAIVTLTYAWAVSNMAKHNAIVRLLPAVETLGSVTVICSDKTGTLTKNEMSLTAVVTSDAHYRVDVHSTDRTSSNFVRDDKFVAERARHHVHRRLNSILNLHAGNRHRRLGSRRSSFPYALSVHSIFKSKHDDHMSVTTTESGGHRSTNSFGSHSHPGLSLDGDDNNRPSPGRPWGAVSATITSNNGSDEPSFESEDTHPLKMDVSPNVGSALVGEEKGTNLVDDPAVDGESPSSDFLRGVLAGGVLCSRSVLGDQGSKNNEHGNPTELALLRAAYFGGVEVEDMKKDSPEVAEVPFSSEYKFMVTVHEPFEELDGPGLGDKYVVHVKGAPDKMIPLCSSQAHAGMVGQDHIEPINADYWMEKLAVLSSHGLRVLSLCRGVVPKNEAKEGQQLGPEFIQSRGQWLTMVGLFAIMDPPRPECIEAIKVAHGAGVRVAMITGDHKDTAIAIGHMLGIVDATHPDALTGPNLDAMDDDQIQEAVMTHNIFARASPQNKLRIVKALQARKQVASMTGDGVNDAPALKAADMGVAMGKEGTDVAREAAEMILADDNFATIVTAVREGRVVWDNLRKVLMVNTPINNAQGMSVLFAMICGMTYSPLTPIQVLYCNLICAVTLGFVTAVEPAEEGIMFNPPRKVGKRLIGRYLLLRIALGTATLVACTDGAAFWVQGLGYSRGQVRSQASNTLTLGAMMVMLSARFSYNSSINPRVLHGNKFAWYSCLIVVLLQLCITYIPGLNTLIFGMEPMDGFQWGLVVLFMFVTFVVMEIEKAIRRYLKAQGADTSDLEYWEGVDQEEPDEAEAISGRPLVPKGASKLGLAYLDK